MAARKPSRDRRRHAIQCPSCAKSARSGAGLIDRPRCAHKGASVCHRGATLRIPQVVKFSSGAHGITVPLTAQIDVSFPKGASFRDWLVNAKASTTPGQIVIQGAEHTVDSVLPLAILDPAVPTYAAGPGAQQWIYATDPTTPSKPTQTVQYFSMNTPVAGAECGRMVFSDLHVSTGSGDTTKVPFPTGCSTTPLTPQEKALEFMLFDLSSCVQSDMDPPVPPTIVK